MYRLDWLARLGRGEMVVVNLRPDTEDAHEFVPFDHAQVLRVLAQIAADFHALARDTSGSETTRLEESVDPRTRHRLRLAMPEEPPRGRTAKEQRDAAMDMVKNNFPDCLSRSILATE
jgi:hypothetical protein